MTTQELCLACNGEGHFHVTMEMAIDAGDRSMAGAPIQCSKCNGDGWILADTLPAREEKEK